MMSTNIKYTTQRKNGQIYFVFYVQLMELIPQSQTILDVVVDDKV